MIDLFAYLQNNSYPGRGIIAGDHNGEVFLAYFIMGRSENSRNRIFVKEDGILKTRAFDESKVKDPSLIIYNAVRSYNDHRIVTNGDQTDTIYSCFKRGKSFRQGLDGREYEPDVPNYTPRISAYLNDREVHLSIIRRENEECRRLYYDYLQKENVAYFISTYDHDGDPLPSFSRDPIRVKITKPFEQFASDLWNCLDQNNKISLYCLEGKKDIIYNRNEETR